ncbi:L-lactate permease [Confluentibacter flavum]|uniref:L-lactate permease n=1 Tax=Confluentibacter flavum TaxID=1909700 RepID=A0A2N3HKE9_9FLAO|nr:lactate permease LctP family transporter [Confluentibacter flavum]PKQ45374.1 lactate permease [Confluentibacter flavum]
MSWNQIIDPFNNIAISAFISVLPIIFIFWALIIKKMKGYKASLIAMVFAIAIAVLIYGMPLELALISSTSGTLYGMFPICWIVITAVFLFNMTVESGQFEVIKHFMASITSDRRLQAILIAFSFGSFLEGMAGFGAPVAITAAMLVGLGFNPLYAAGICLIANTAPVAFGSIGIPITVASKVSEIPEMIISQMVGRTLPIISLIIPFYLVVIMSGFKKAVEVLPAILVSGISFALLQFLTSNFIGPELPDIIAGVGSIVSLVIFLKYWKPKSIWRFSDEALPDEKRKVFYSKLELMKAWSPFILLTVVIIFWGLLPVKKVLDFIGMVEFKIPGLHEKIIDINGNGIPHIFKFNSLSAAGTGIFMAALLAIPLIGLSYKSAAKIFFSTIKQLKFAIITIATIMGFAYIVNDSGMTTTMAETLAKTGFLFPFFAPILGWLGVFITGSDTSSNALFGKLQANTATSIGVDPVVTVAANVSGGVVGKMISPHSIAVAAAAGGLVGRESDLFRFTLKHSFILLIFVCLIVLSQAYLFDWIVPKYELTDTIVEKLSSELTNGYIYLCVLGLLVTAFVSYILISNKLNNKKIKYPKD